jgi:hypothetical protein
MLRNVAYFWATHGTALQTLHWKVCCKRRCRQTELARTLGSLAGNTGYSLVRRSAHWNNFKSTCSDSDDQNNNRAGVTLRALPHKFSKRLQNFNAGRVADSSPTMNNYRRGRNDRYWL